MHRGTIARHHGGDDVLGSFLLEQFHRNLRHRLVGRALTHADQHNTVADRHHVAAFKRRVPGGFILVTVRLHRALLQSPAAPFRARLSHTSRL